MRSDGDGQTHSHTHAGTLTHTHEDKPPLILSSQTDLFGKLLCKGRVIDQPKGFKTPHSTRPPFATPKISKKSNLQTDHITHEWQLSHDNNFHDQQVNE